MSDKHELDAEREALAFVFKSMLARVTADGGRKRRVKLKSPWWQDESHMAAVWSHFRKREMGEMEDLDSGCHPFVHAAWRLLAVAYQETEGKIDPRVLMGNGSMRDGWS